MAWTTLDLLLVVYFIDNTHLADAKAEQPLEFPAKPFRLERIAPGPFQCLNDAGSGSRVILSRFFAASLLNRTSYIQLGL